MAFGLLLQLLRRQPVRLYDAVVQRTVRQVPHGRGGEGEAQVVPAAASIGIGGLPLVGADERGQLDFPAGFLEGFAASGFQQALVRLKVAGRLVEHQTALGALLDHQQFSVTDHHRCHGDVGLPEAAFAVAHLEVVLVAGEFDFLVVGRFRRDVHGGFQRGSVHAVGQLDHEDQHVALDLPAPKLLRAAGSQQGERLLAVDAIGPYATGGRKDFTDTQSVDLLRSAGDEDELGPVLLLIGIHHPVVAVGIDFELQAAGAQPRLHRGIGGMHRPREGGSAGEDGGSGSGKRHGLGGFGEGEYALWLWSRMASTRGRDGGGERRQRL